MDVMGGGWTITQIGDSGHWEATDTSLTKLMASVGSELMALIKPRGKERKPNLRFLRFNNFDVLGQHCLNRQVSIFILCFVRIFPPSVIWLV